MKMEIKAIFKGRVQGVFFRFTVKKHADKLNLKGYAKNLPDGNVEVRAIGEKEVLEKFIKEIIDHPGHAIVDEVKKTFSKVSRNYVDFETI